MTEIQSANLLDKLVGLSKIASVVQERQSVIRELLDYSAEQRDALSTTETKIPLDKVDQAKIVEIGVNILQGQMQDVLDGKVRYSSSPSINDLLDETLNATAGFRLAPKVLAGLDQQVIHEVVKTNFPDSWNFFDTLNAYLSNEEIEMQGTAPAVINAMDGYIEGFQEHTVGAVGSYDADNLVYPFRTHGKFLDSNSKAKAASLAAAVAEEVMTGTHHHIYNLARMDAARRKKGPLNTPDDVKVKLARASAENGERLSFFDEIEIFGNQPYLPNDIPIDRDASLIFEESHPANHSNTSEWATETCRYGAALIPLAANDQKAEVATKFIYPISLAQRINQHLDPKGLQALLEILPKDAGLREQLDVKPKAIEGPNTGIAHDWDFEHE